MVALPRWMYGDPADAYERLRALKEQRPELFHKEKRQRAREELEALFKDVEHDSKAQVKHRNPAR